METLKIIQAILISLAALVFAVTVLIAVTKGQKIDIEKTSNALSKLISTIPPIRHTVTHETQETLERIARSTEAIQKTVSKPNGSTSEKIHSPRGDLA